MCDPNTSTLCDTKYCLVLQNERLIFFMLPPNLGHIHYTVNIDDIFAWVTKNKYSFEMLEPSSILYLCSKNLDCPMLPVARWVS